ncbi:MAG: glucose-6-phosphate isomerase, partial [Treponema sp.]|nr:glucose-6-phosphate isomerase [Treponema sp.]
MQYVDFDKTRAFEKLSALSKKGKDFKFLLSPERVKTSTVMAGGGLSYSWAAKGVEKAELEVLQALADEQDLIGKYKALLDGEIINTGENRKVLHHLLRGQLGKAVIAEGKNLGTFYGEELERFSVFADLVRAGKIKGATGKNFSAVVQIGIGGSDLGPRALYLALENWAAKEGKNLLKAEFISNVDPDDASRIVSSVPLDETLFVLVSKSGTTQETLANELFVK